ncbi:hypothetical protein P0136_08100 [Lentisphaerota bacterium ZTH]|nr:hypothetical protein JYG24_00790 [Lentisphaerota bacterium]WET05325.1 hypothetical protein P0136_08100 [Lentisphaerota bacterium ZTH]
MSRWFLSLITIFSLLSSIKSPGQVKLLNFDEEWHNRLFMQWSILPAWELSQASGRYYSTLYQEIPEIFISQDNSYNITSEPVPYRAPLLVINMNEYALETLPRTMRQQIIPHISQFDNMGEVIANNNLKCYVTAVVIGSYGGGWALDYPSANHVGEISRISFHGFATKLFPHENTEEFSCVMPVGLFVPKGLVGGIKYCIPIEKLSAQPVEFYTEPVSNDWNFHLCGPNNARFLPVSKASSFWTVAKIGEKGDQIMVTYFLLLNTSELADAAKQIIENTTRNDQFFTMLNSIGQLADNSDDEFNSGILHDWVDNVKHICRPLDSGEAPDKPVEGDPKLAYESFHKFNIVEHQGRFYGIPQDEGAFDMNRIVNGGYSAYFPGYSLDKVKAELNKVKDQIYRFLQPELAHENYKDFNIISYRGKTYGILRSEGAFDLNKIMNEEYSIYFQGDSVDEVKEKIDDY